MVAPVPPSIVPVFQPEPKRRRSWLRRLVVGVLSVIAAIVVLAMIIPSEAKRVAVIAPTSSTAPAAPNYAPGDDTVSGYHAIGNVPAFSVAAFMSSIREQGIAKGNADLLVPFAQSVRDMDTMAAIALIKSRLFLNEYDAGYFLGAAMILPKAA